MSQINFTLLGEMPSKKNAWARGTDGHVFIPSKIKDQIDDFLWQIKAFGKQKSFTGPVGVVCRFSCERDRDLDNMVTTLLDILQKSGIISNDKYVWNLAASKVRHKTQSFVEVTIDEV